MVGSKMSAKNIRRLFSMSRTVIWTSTFSKEQVCRLCDTVRLTQKVEEKTMFTVLELVSPLVFFRYLSAMCKVKIPRFHTHETPAKTGLKIYFVVQEREVSAPFCVEPLRLLKTGCFMTTESKECSGFINGSQIKKYPSPSCTYRRFWSLCCGLLRLAYYGFCDYDEFLRGKMFSNQGVQMRFVAYTMYRFGAQLFF